MLIPSMKRSHLDTALERLAEEINDVLDSPITIGAVDIHSKFAGFIGDNLRRSALDSWIFIVLLIKFSLSILSHA